MEESQRDHHSFVPEILPWLIGLAALMVYLVTLNHWVNLNSLAWVSTATGWDWSLPQGAPLFFALTFPIRALPNAWQPIAMNVTAALAAAATLALLARSVVLLPHDRTHDQRQRERSEYSLLSIPTRWVPPVLAVAACGLEWTFWEHATAATNEMLSLLLFAYPIRCLLEFRLDHRRRWLYQASFLYALGMTNNAGTIGLFPFFLAAMIWMMGRAFFDFRFLVRMFVFGLAGISLYLLLPILWVFTDPHFHVLAVLHWALGAQKAFLFTPGLRNQAMLLSLTSLVPIALIGIRWPSSFGDTSAAGAKMTQVMFRLMHLLFLAGCLWTAFDFQYSPRALGFGYSFLTFYYLGALAIGYYSGYVLLVFSGRSTRHRHHHSFGRSLGLLLRAVVCAAVVAIPGLLIYRNLPRIRGENGELLRNFARLQAANLPERESLVLSDDPFDLFLLEGYFAGSGSPKKHLLLYTKALALPFYQRRLEDRYPGHWTSLAGPDDANVDPMALLQSITGIALKSIPFTPIYYLQPSFGYYFERFYSIPSGLVQQLKLYSTNEFFPPELPAEVISANQKFWADVRSELHRAQKLAALHVADASYVAEFYSRALNDWGVRLQRQDKVAEAADSFQKASGLNTNNIAALVNAEFNGSLRSGKRPALDLTPHSIENRFGGQWDQLLASNGPFDAPDFCHVLGTKFFDQGLSRQAAVELRRAHDLEPENPLPVLALANLYLNVRMPDQTLQVVSEIRRSGIDRSLSGPNQVQLTQVEAGAYFAKNDLAKTERLLLDGLKRYSTNQAILDSLLQFYGGQDRWSNAVAAIDQQLALAPDDTALLFKKASVYGAINQYDRALELVNKLLQRTPRDRQALLLKGAVYLQTKEFDGALAAFNEVLELDPDNLDAELSAGAVYVEKKQYDKALPFFAKILKKQPNNWAALRNQAIVNLRRGALNDARQDYESLLALVPNYYPAFFGLAEIAYQRKENEAAARNYELYLKYATNSVTPELTAEKKQVLDRLKELRPAKL